MCALGAKMGGIQAMGMHVWLSLKDLIIRLQGQKGKKCKARRGLWCPDCLAPQSAASARWITAARIIAATQRGARADDRDYVRV